MDFTYLDNAATTKVLQGAAAAAKNAMEQAFGNPSSIHELGRAARNVLESARCEVAKTVGCNPKDLVFTSGGTESINTAIFAAAMKNKHLGKHIISTEIEHDATLKALGQLKMQDYEITLIPPERDGSVSAEKVINAMRSDTILVSMMAVNNETGAILPYEEIAAAGRQKAPNALFHLDGVQGLCKLALNLKNIDTASFSAHKIGGMKGCGALYIREGLHLRPLLFGGGQEGAMRSGTEAVPQIAAFGTACAQRLQNMDRDRRHMEHLTAYLLDKLTQSAVAFANNTPKNHAPHILNISLLKGRSEVIIRMLEQEKIYVSGGSACSKGKKSHVLLAMHVPPANIEGAIRVSLCPENTQHDMDNLCGALQKLSATL